jgi:hypothetical protein
MPGRYEIFRQTKIGFEILLGEKDRRGFRSTLKPSQISVNWQLFGVVHAPNNNKKKEKRERKEEEEEEEEEEGGRRRKKKKKERKKERKKGRGKRKKKKGGRRKETLARKQVKKTGKGHGGFNSIPHFILE